MYKVVPIKDSVCKATNWSSLVAAHLAELLLCRWLKLQILLFKVTGVFLCWEEKGNIIWSDTWAPPEQVVVLPSDPYNRDKTCLSLRPRQGINRKDYGKWWRGGGGGAWTPGRDGKWLPMVTLVTPPRLSWGPAHQVGFTRRASWAQPLPMSNSQFPTPGNQGGHLQEVADTASEFQNGEGWRQDVKRSKSFPFSAKELGWKTGTSKYAEWSKL